MPVKQGNNRGKKTPAGKKFKPGQSGNPKGRPPSVRYIPDILKKIGRETITQEKLLTQIRDYFPEVKEVTFQEAVLRMAYLYAIQGKAWAIEFIAERTEGKVPQTISVLDDQEDREKFKKLSTRQLMALANAETPNKK